MQSRTFTSCCVCSRLVDKSLLPTSKKLKATTFCRKRRGNREPETKKQKKVSYKKWNYYTSLFVTLQVAGKRNLTLSNYVFNALGFRISLCELAKIFIKRRSSMRVRVVFPTFFIFTSKTSEMNVLSSCKYNMRADFESRGAKRRLQFLVFS